jgi:hypothetical protein
VRYLPRRRLSERAQQAAYPCGHHRALRDLPPQHGQLPWRDLQPYRRGAGKLRHLPQRDNRAGQAADPSSDHRGVRHLPPDDGLNPGHLQSRRGQRGQLRQLPQRDDGDRQVRHPLRDHPVLRCLPPDHGLAADHRLRPRHTLLQGPFCRGGLPLLPQHGQRGDQLEKRYLQARLRGLSRRKFQGQLPQEGLFAAHPVHGL